MKAALFNLPDGFSTSSAIPVAVTLARNGFSVFGNEHFASKMREFNDTPVSNDLAKATFATILITVGDYSVPGKVYNCRGNATSVDIDISSLSQPTRAKWIAMMMCLVETDEKGPCVFESISLFLYHFFRIVLQSVNMLKMLRIIIVLMPRIQRARSMLSATLCWMIRSLQRSESSHKNNLTVSLLNASHRQVFQNRFYITWFAPSTPTPECVTTRSGFFILSIAILP